MQINLNRRVGSGKSVLLNGIMGETIKMSGSIQIASRRMAFCNQTPWLLNSTLKTNILGIAQYQKEWYDTVLRACGLQEDISHFPDGDQTTIGPKGSALSGGQRQRVALARAIYSKADILVLDDIFSGLDAVTEKLLFKRLFSEHGLLRESRTTVILVTHSGKNFPIFFKFMLRNQLGSSLAIIRR